MLQTDSHERVQKYMPWFTGQQQKYKHQLLRLKMAGEGHELYEMWQKVAIVVEYCC
jgi:hypothetical protein